jgi:hypothetical protein
VPGESGYRARVGVRELRWRRGRLLVNGRRLRLRGAAIQEDAAGRGDAMTAADMDATIARLQRIGANATRAQHALSPALLERLDAAGILVWQHVGPFDVPGHWAARTPADRQRALRRVRLDVLHGLPAGAGRIYRVLDAVGATHYEGWYANLHGSPHAQRANTRRWLRRLHALFPQKVLVISEFGGEANRRNPRDAPGGVDFQARLLARHIQLYRAQPWLSGMIVWSLQDFALRPDFRGGSVRAQAPEMALQPGINAKGLFTYGGRPKPAADVVKRLYGQP